MVQRQTSIKHTAAQNLNSCGSTVCLDDEIARVNSIEDFCIPKTSPLVTLLRTTVDVEWGCLVVTEDQSLGKNGILLSCSSKNNEFGNVLGVQWLGVLVHRSSSFLVTLESDQGELVGSTDPTGSNPKALPALFTRTSISAKSEGRLFKNGEIWSIFETSNDAMKTWIDGYDFRSSSLRALSLSSLRAVSTSLMLPAPASAKYLAVL
ncbi:hypothetical protein OGAPHI_007362 [Ogataea philodendri]|uniref:Uncharacterized protein n=1 Tax=Ogataea philodendri TaxID=1378263 RepID=A0A9P8NVI7_9ASCO|nr:uncharacterized protein OGAPHI_007362 [Ogataea philodendri]KAH3660157.1 hypothetical protein OGAPHI_007362 [Ogataea philodendri]